MKSDTTRLLQQQAEKFQELTLDDERAAELAPVVESFNGAVAETAGLLPYDVDATAFFTALQAFRDDWDPS